MSYILIILLSYLLGCSNMAFYLARWKRVDFRSKGSGNLGASNATVLLGWKAGVLVGIHDIFKAFLAVHLACLLFPSAAHIGAVAGVSSILGHIFPFYLRFQGGKGFASYLGMTFALNWKLALGICAAVILVTILTDYIVVGTVTTIICVPAYLGITGRDWAAALILLIASGVILYKHLENFQKIRRGKEIGLRSTLQGKNRV